MQVKTIASDPRPGTAEFEQLRELVTSKGNSGMVALALAASEMPLGSWSNRPEHPDYVTFEAAVVYAVQGLIRIGVETARRRDEELRATVRADIRLIDARVPTTDPRRRELARQERELRGVSSRRYSWCNDVAHTLMDNGDNPAGRAGDLRFAPAPTTARPMPRSRAAARSIGARRELVRAA